MTAREITRARGGDWYGTYGVVPGPGHSRKDRSLKVWDFNGKIYVYSFVDDDWRDCRAHLGLDDDWRPTPPRKPAPAPAPPKPPARVRDLLRTAAPVDLVPDAVGYLKSRHLWPLPERCTLKAHSGAPYWDAGDPPILVGRFPALLAEVRDVAGALVTCHVTYLYNNEKLPDRAPRKLLSATSARVGCAVRLVPEGPVLAVAEGVETALAAHRILKVPTWACLSTSLLQAFQPPPGVEQLVIAADRDVAGLVAAWNLRDRRNLRMDLRVSRGADFAADLEDLS